MSPPGRRRWSWRIATIAGVDLRVHATFPLLLVLVGLLASGREGPGTVAGLAWVIALFACVVVHELSHSLVARRCGVTVTEIELYPLGGVSKMERPPDEPGEELRIAVAGPLASLGLAALFGLLAVVAGDGLWPPALYGGDVLTRLAWVNLLLAGFNLLPALPMDGGRVLRAVLEPRLGHRRATTLAAGVARVLAAGMVVAGLFVNVWLVLIGVFVALGSAAEEAALDHPVDASGRRRRPVPPPPPPPLPSRRA